MTTKAGGQRWRCGRRAGFRALPRGVQRSRCIGYDFVTPLFGPWAPGGYPYVTISREAEARLRAFDVDRVLAEARQEGVIVNYDDGRGDVPWFEGPPGPALRALRDRFLAAGFRRGEAFRALIG